MINHFLSKLSSINHQMAIHKGDAKERLAAYSSGILLLPEGEVPSKFQKDLDKLNKLLKETYASYSNLPPEHSINFGRMHRSTASRYIKLLWDIEYELRQEER
jgi:hypothetical protein